MVLRQLQTTLVPVVIENAGSPLPGLTFADVDVQLLKPVDGSTWETKQTLTADEFIAVGSGVYHIKMIGSEDLDALGEMLAVVRPSLTGPAFDEEILNISVIPQSSDALIPPTTCKIFGDLMNPGTLPSPQQDVFLYLKEQPVISGGFVATNERYFTKTNAQGHFEVYVPRLAKVVIDIPNAGIRKQFDVPDQESFSLLDIIAL